MHHVHVHNPLLTTVSLFFIMYTIVAMEAVVISYEASSQEEEEY
jgi:hypothetical protein